MNGVKGYPSDVMHRDKTYLRIPPGSWGSNFHSVRSLTWSFRWSYSLNVSSIRKGFKLLQSFIEVRCDLSRV